MGVFRGGLLVVVSVLLFTSILVQGFLLTIFLSLSYDAVAPQLSSVASEFVEVPEASVLKESGQFDEAVSSMVEEKYYEDYDCNFFDCPEKTSDPFSLFSKHAQDYWRTKFFYALAICLFLMVAVFFLVEHKSNFFLICSVFFILSSFVFLNLEFVVGLILKPFLVIDASDSALFPFFKLFSFFLSQSSSVFTYFFVIGLLLLGGGLVTKFFGWGFEISNYFKKKEESEKIPDSASPATISPDEIKKSSVSPENSSVGKTKKVSTDKKEKKTK